MYEYLNEMVKDIVSVFDNYGWLAENREDLREEMYDKLFVDDAVTGNASGSYTFNRNIAKEYVIDNIELVDEMSRDYAISYDEIGQRFCDEDWEWFDVSIRCHLLAEAIDEYLDYYYDD